MSWAIGLVLISVPLPYTYSSISLGVLGAVAVMGMWHTVELASGLSMADVAFWLDGAVPYVD